MTGIMVERIELRDGGWLELWPQLVEDHLAWLDRLRGELSLAAERYRMFGREVTSPRLVAWHGEPGTGYAYSGVHHEPRPLTDGLAELRAVVMEASGLSFNAVLCNLYRHGDDGMGWHRDAEPEIGPDPDDRWVASLSLGASRRFVLKHDDDQKRWERPLGAGDLLVMRGTTQSHYRHALPKTKRATGLRLNLTFRHIVTQ